jgi:diacylglycerol kinase (ATP)
MAGEALMGVLARRWSSEATEPVLARPLVRPGTDLGRAIRLAVIHNPKSGGNRRRGRLLEIREQIAGARIPHREGDTLEGLVAGTQSLLRDGAEVIAVNGGDGTVQAVLTGLLRADAEGPLPLVAVLPGGTTNTTARNVGYGVGTSAALAELAFRALGGRLEGVAQKSAVVRVERGNDPDPLFAMFFGAGGVYHGIRLAKEQVESRGMRGQLGAGLALAVFLTKIGTGEGGTLFPPLLARIAIDGGPAQEDRLLGLLVSTMERQFLGLKPYWGTGPGSLMVTALGYSPRHVLRSAVSVMRGRPNRFATPENGYRSCNADRMELELDSGFTLDGELFAAGPGGRIAVSGERSIFFLRRGVA